MCLLAMFANGRPALRLGATMSVRYCGTALTKACLDPSPALRDPAIPFACELLFSQFRHQCRIFNIDGFGVEKVAHDSTTGAFIGLKAHETGESVRGAHASFH